MMCIAETSVLPAHVILIGASAVLQDADRTIGSLHSEMCIEPWHAVQLERQQSRAALLLTAIELLQSQSKIDANGKAALLLGFVI